MTAISMTTSKAAKILIASMLALTVLGTGFSSNADAKSKYRKRAAAGVIGAIIGGAIIAGSQRDRGYDDDDDYDDAPRQSGWERHVARCYASYRSYNERSDTYVGYDGIERRCRK